MNCKKKLLLFTCTCLFIVGNTQNKIANYKTEADRLIYKCFIAALHPKITCTAVVLSYAGSDEETELEFDEVKDSSKQFDYIKFMYSFHSDYLEQDFVFDVTVSKEGELFHDSAFAINIPKCVRQQMNCGFISKAKAIQIAIQDSIAYPESLTAAFSWNDEDGKGFWFVTSPPEKHIINSKQTGGINRFIDANTGRIIRKRKDDYR